MKPKLLILFFILAPFYCLGQHALVGDPTYNKTVPRLLMMKHNESSSTLSNTRISPADFEGKISSKETNIFVTYKRNEKVGTKVGNYAELTVPPNRLMDFHLIYGYAYKIYIDEATSSNGTNLYLKLTPGDKVGNISLENHILQNGKVQSKRISPKTFETVLSDSVVAIKVNSSKLVAGSYLTLNVSVSSLAIGEIGPFSIENIAYTEFISFNMPEIFKYNLIAKGISFDLVSEEKRPYELLHFKRDKEGTINKFEVGNYCYKWKISSKGGQDSGYKFELTELKFPDKKDIGILPTDIIL